MTTVIRGRIDCTVTWMAVRKGIFSVRLGISTKRLSMKITMALPRPISSPGMAPPQKRAPVESPVAEATSTAGMLGGIRGPWMAVAAVTAQEKSLV